jgi:hypothetical protein
VSVQAGGDEAERNDDIAGTSQTASIELD